MGTMTGCFFCPVNSCRKEERDLYYAIPSLNNL